MYVLDVHRGTIGGMQELRIRPAVMDDVLDDLAVDIGLEMTRRGYKLADLEWLVGWGVTRRNQFSRWQRDVGGFGIEAAFRLAARLGIPVVFLCGDEARALPQIAAPSIVPALEDLSAQVAA